MKGSRLTIIEWVFTGWAITGLIGCSQEKTTRAQSPSPMLVNSTKKPLENRFTRTVLADHLNEPMELAVTHDGRVFFIDRTGAFRKYDPATNMATQINTFRINPVEGNGLLGITLDPDFDRNHYLYFFYTPQDGPLRHQVSRFILGPDSLDFASEEVLLQIPIDLEASAHTGGSLQFDEKNNLFISVGDNTDPSQSDGFAPIDERKGRLVFDAQRSAANTHDLRGKILRITPGMNGRAGAAPYTIPDGNLFPKDGTKGKPEIYVMGCRNPYRMSVDTKTGILYWGEIGPDSGVDGPQGPKGYDEINQAKAPGNFGWPYFVGDNKPYLDYDFATRHVGDTFNVNKPINESPNNTGSRELPPAQKPLIWYPYDQSREFPEVKNGGRSAMAGPVYHFEAKLNSETKFPAYYDQGLFIFDWMRNWMITVRLDEQGHFKSLEPFMPGTRIDKPIDMQFGTDGALYLLEYGENYGMNNADASLVRITFNPHNRPPVAIAQASDTLGTAPLRVRFTGAKSYDYDENDQLSYEWRIGSRQFIAKNADTAFTFDQPGIYQATLTVTDTHGKKAQAEVEVKVGNTPPVLSLESPQNQSFYWDKETFPYQIVVKDREDTHLDPARIEAYFDYIAHGKDIPIVLLGHQKNPLINKNRGKALIAQNDCKSCHVVDKRAVGPSFIEIATRYRQEKAVDKLADKVIKGGSGAWRPHAMSAHPQLTREDASEMVQYILTLADQVKAATSIPATGVITLKDHVGKNEPGTYVLSASYTDGGGKVVGPLTGHLLRTLRSPKVQAEDHDAVSNLKLWPSSTGIGFHLGSSSNCSHLMFRQIDLKGIASITYRIASLNCPATLELHLDAADGPVVSALNYLATGSWENWVEVNAPVKPTSGLHDLYFVFVNKEKPDNELGNLDWIVFNREKPTKKKSGRKTDTSSLDRGK